MSICSLYNVVKKSSVIILCVICFVLQTTAQLSHEKIDQLITDPAIKYPKAVKQFYAINGYKFCWLGTTTNNLQQLFIYIQQSPSLGLKQQDYQSDIFNGNEKLNTLNTERDSLLTEIKCTDAAIHFFNDVMMGNSAVLPSYNGLHYFPDCFNVPELIIEAINTNQFSLLLTGIEPKTNIYALAKERLVFFNQMINSSSFKDAVVISNKVSNTNKVLIIRLYQLGCLDSDTIFSITNAALITAIKKAQSLFGLLQDGQLRSTVLQAFNVPLAKRQLELQHTLNTTRWLNCIQRNSNSIVIVNIPSATFHLYQYEKIIIASRVIVGKKTTPTPTLCSEINEVIIYPYWNVPYKIATKELLPIIKRNRSYLMDNNFQVLDSRGVILNPATINWQALSAGYFPYQIRQSTGCDNSLGLIKLNFYNPFSVYLHDTPGKLLFSMNKRFFSHGCMRLQKAMEVANYILKDNAIAIDTITQKGCIKNQAPIIVPATEAVPVFVLYNTAWINETGSISFYDDVYNKFAATKQ
jgi:L,D-transpeptidase YcbB